MKYFKTDPTKYVQEFYSKITILYTYNLYNIVYQLYFNFFLKKDCVLLVSGVFPVILLPPGQTLFFCILKAERAAGRPGT